MKSKKQISLIIACILVVLGITVVSVRGIQNKKQLEKNIALEEEIFETPDEKIKVVSEEWIFYQQENILWKVKADGTNKSKVLELDNRITWAYLEGKKEKPGHIYYLYEGNIVKINLEDETKERVSEEIFDQIGYMEDSLAGERWLAFTKSNSSEVLLIDGTGSLNLHNLRSGITSIVKNKDYLVYSTNGAIYRYDMVNLQEKEIASYQNYKEEDYRVAMQLIGIEDNFIYYRAEGNEEWVQEFYKINIDTLEGESFHEASSGLNEFGESYIKEGYLYTTYYPMRHVSVHEQISLKDGQVKSGGQVLDQDEKWVYKLADDQILKFNLKTEEETVIRSVYPLEWYTDFKSRSAIKIGDWIYFNDYKKPPTDEERNTPENLVLNNFRINVKTGEEQEITQELDQYLSMSRLIGNDGALYILDQKGISIIKNDELKQIVTLEEVPQDAIIIHVNRRKKINLNLRAKAREAGDWIYYNLKIPKDVWGEQDVLYKVRQDGSDGDKIFESDKELLFWEVVGDEIIYASELEWEAIYTEQGKEVDSMWENNFINAIYSVNEDGTAERYIVKGDIFQMHDPSTGIYAGFEEGYVAQWYNIVLINDGWIYFQTYAGVAETDWSFEPYNFSKIRLDGTGLTKISEKGIAGNFIKEIDGWAYFDSVQWPGEFSDIERIHLETGEKNTMAKNAAIIGMKGNTMYFYTDYKEGVYSLDTTTMEEKYVVSAPAEYYWDVSIYLEGDKIYRINDDYESGDYGESILIHTLDLTEEEIKEIDYEGYGRDGIIKDGYIYYVNRVEGANSQGESWFSNMTSELYKKDLYSGHRTLLSSHTGYMSDLVISD